MFGHYIVGYKKVQGKNLIVKGASEGDYPSFISRTTISLGPFLMTLHDLFRIQGSVITQLITSVRVGFSTILFQYWKLTELYYVLLYQITGSGFELQIKECSLKLSSFQSVGKMSAKHA